MKLDHASVAKLVGVHADLQKVVERAINHAAFKVLEGLRTPARQMELVKAGASWTVNSRHLTGHAVDLGALVNGEVTWQWAAYFPLAKAVAIAAEEVDVPVEWGGYWGLLDPDLDPETAQMDYIAECKKKGIKAKLDGPHMQLPRKFYP